MRVLVYSDLTSRFMNGVNSGIGQLLKGLTERGHDVALAADQPNRYFADCQHFKVKSPHTWRSTLQLKDIVASYRPDVFHYMVLGIRVVDQISRAIGNVPLVIDVHSVVPKERKFGRFYGTRNLHYGARMLRYLPNHLAWRLTLRRLGQAQILVHSEAMRQELIQMGVPRARTEVIHFGCAIEPELPTSAVRAPERPRLGTVAAFIHTKGIHDVLEAIAAGRTQGFDATYKVVGHIRDHEYFAFLHRRVDQLGLRAAVEFETNADDAQKLTFVRDLDCYVQPSHEEGFCIAFLEGALLARRAVGTSVGAIREVVGGRSGLRVVQPKDPRGLLKTVREALMEPVDDHAVRQRQAELREEFSWSRFIDGHERLYSRGVGRGGFRPPDDHARRLAV